MYMVKFSGSTITVVETDKPHPPPALSPHSDSVEFKNYFQGFPWWFGDEESACQFKRDGWFDHWSGKIPHASEPQSHVPQILRLCSRAWEPQLQSPPQLLKPRHPKAHPVQQKPAHHNQRVAPLTQQQRPNTANK